MNQALLPLSHPAAFHCNFIYVVVQSKYAACEQKRLSYVEKQACGNVVYVAYLIAYKQNGTDYQEHSADILGDFVGLHYPIMAT